MHRTLDPYGVAVRESRDSDEHPNSLAIAVLFDVTGSMGQVPVVLQTKLPQLLGLLLRKGYAAHPHILFGAIGDATCDRVALQIGQFESDNRMDDHLGNIFLEGGGGGQMTESYELALYFMARHTATDCFEKRGRRGYLFIIGDEMAYPAVKASEVRSVVGDPLGENVALSQIVAEARRRWDVYYLLPEGSSYAGTQQVLDFRRRHLAQNAVALDDLDAVCETIALTVGLGEGNVDVAGGLADLRDLGSDKTATVGKALARIGGRAGGRRVPPGALAVGQRDREAVAMHTIVVDLSYGDAGKGAIVDWLCASALRPARAVVRFNGGAQAAHNVVTPDGRHHTFSQFGSGTFTPGVATHLSRFMLVEPLALVGVDRWRSSWRSVVVGSWGPTRRDKVACGPLLLDGPLGAAFPAAALAGTAA